MTKDEARLILEKSELVASWTNDQGETWSFQIGNFFKELPTSFSFIVFPYSTKTPLDPDDAYLFYVLKDTGKVIRSDDSMTEEELKRLKKKPLMGR